MVTINIETFVREHVDHQSINEGGWGGNAYGAVNPKQSPWGSLALINWMLLPFSPNGTEMSPPLLVRALRASPVQLSVMSSRWRLSKPDASQEGGVVGHADERVLIHDAYGNPLAGTQQAHSSRVARVKLALARLNAAGAAEERVGVHHHFVACNVREVEVVHLMGKRETP